MKPHPNFYLKVKRIKESLKSKFLCRDQEIDALFSLFGGPTEKLLSSVLLHGHSSTGKTSILLELFHLLKIPFAVCNCLESYTNRLLYEPIIQKFLGKQRCADENIKCDSMMQFVHLLKTENIVNEDFKGSPIVIVLEQCNKLSNLQLQSFIQLAGLVDKPNLCCVLVSQIVPDCFNTFLNNPIYTVVFPQYTFDEVRKILFHYRPLEYPEEFYSNFLNFFLRYFVQVCRDLKELQHWVRIVFDKYIEPINKKELNYEDAVELFRAITPYCKKVINCIYLGTDFEIKRAKQSETQKPVVVLDLPYHTKYLLIAAYLASFNLPKYDRRLYLKESGKVKRRAEVKLKIDKATDQLTGPRTFGLCRLLAIFYSIMNEEVNLCANIYSQIASLIELRLLMRVNNDNLDEPKFKATVSFSCVEDVSKTLNFNIKKYLLI